RENRIEFLRCRRWQRRQRHNTTLYPTLNSWDDY
ncbi:MAG: hypothetical protein ACI92S_004243, partial [Planctomycetaceae bacterium]